MLAAQDDSWQLRVRGGGGHDLLTVSPLLESAACGVAVAPIGLTNMMNAGGAVLRAELEGEWAGQVLGSRISMLAAGTA